MSIMELPGGKGGREGGKAAGWVGATEGGIKERREGGWKGRGGKAVGTPPSSPMKNWSTHSLPAKPDLLLEV